MINDYSSSANLSMLPFSWNCAWTNANYLDLPITEEEAGLVVSVVCVGGFFGNLIYLFLIDIIGRKNSILLLALPSIVINHYVKVFEGNSKLNFHGFKLKGGLVPGILCTKCVLVLFESISVWCGWRWWDGSVTSFHI